MALHRIQQAKKYQISRLVTTVNGSYERVTMHGLRESLLDQQVQELGIPLTKIVLPENADMDTYNRIMSETMGELKQANFKNTAFGDIFLEDLRKYREDQLAKHDIAALFPLWKENTSELAKSFIDQGFKSIIVACNDELGEEFVGRQFDHGFLNDLPDSIDPCGENGEFHTFCYDGPIFQNPIMFEIGEKTVKHYPAPDGSDKKSSFWFCDLIPTT